MAFSQDLFGKTSVYFLYYRYAFHDKLIDFNQSYEKLTMKTAHAHGDKIE